MVFCDFLSTIGEDGYIAIGMVGDFLFVVFMECSDSIDIHKTGNGT